MRNSAIVFAQGMLARCALTRSYMPGLALGPASRPMACSVRPVDESDDSVNPKSRAATATVLPCIEDQAHSFAGTCIGRSVRAPAASETRLAVCHGGHPYFPFGKMLHRIGSSSSLEDAFGIERDKGGCLRNSSMAEAPRCTAIGRSVRVTRGVSDGDGGRRRLVTIRKPTRWDGMRYFRVHVTIVGDCLRARR